MFLIHCDHCGRKELRGSRSLRTDPTGVFVADCRACGTTAVIAGRRAADPVVTTAVKDAPVPTAA